MSSPFFEEIPEEPKKKPDSQPRMEEPQNTFDNNEADRWNQNDPNNNYPNGWGNNYGRNIPETNGLATASMIFGIVSVCMCFCPYLSLPGSIIAIILGILSQKGKPMETRAIAGIVLGAVALVILIALIIYVMQMMKDPEFMKAIEEYMQSQGLGYTN